MSVKNLKNKITPFDGAVFYPTDLMETSISHRMENGKIIRTKGLNWLITAFFVVGDMAGGGLVTLPNAFVRTTLIGGLILIGFMTFIATFTAYALGKCWDILQIIWPEYREHCRKPYSEIGYRSFGGWLKHLISFCIDITFFGVSVVFLLLSAENIDVFLKNTFNIKIGVCCLIIIIAIILLPVLFLKSPADFWWLIILAMMATTGAVILIMVGSGLDFKTCGGENANFPNLSLNNFFLGLGSFLFAYGGHGAFPTIQHDMKKPSEFTKSAILAFILIDLLYLPVIIFGYASYGDSLTDNIIGSLQISWIQQITNLLITFHCLFATTMIFNPLNQEIEEFFHIPHEFGLKRIIVRTTVLIAVVFVAETVPKFGPMLNLVGSSTLTLTSLVFPIFCYLKLAEMKRKFNFIKKRDEINGKEKIIISDFELDTTFMEAVKNTPKIILVLSIITIVFGMIGGGAATYSAILEVTTTNFIPPCYLSSIFKENISNNTGIHQCCGKDRNLHFSIDFKHSTFDVCKHSNF